MTATPAAKAHKPKRNRKETPKQTGTTYIAFVLDRSGSMQFVRDATISGFNEYIQDRQKEQDVNYRFSLTTFNMTPTKVYQLVEMDKVANLTYETYQPSGGTALYDAIAATMSDIEGQITDDDRVLFIMMTDGQENASHETTLAQVKERISTKEKSGKWTFVYLGANQDAWSVGFGLGISAKGSTLTYGHSSVGTYTAMASLSRGTHSYSAHSGGTVDSFFSPEDQQQQNGLGVAPAVEVNPGASVPPVFSGLGTADQLSHPWINGTKK